MVTPLPPVTDSDERFGQDNILPDHYTAIPGIADAAWTQLAMDAGARFNRWVFYWREIEATQDVYDYSAHDPVVTANLSAGLKIQGLLIGTPPWASLPDNPGVPTNLYLDWNDPDNHWGQFVYNIVSHYLGQIGFWIIWNEPNLEFFWQGTPQDYYQLLKIGYQATKAADPTAQVLFGGLSGLTNLSFLDEVLATASADPTAADNNFYFDVFVWHAYSRSSQLYDGTLYYRDKLAAYNLDQPISINETNIPAYDDPAVPHAGSIQWHGTQEEQASYMIQAYAYAFAAEVQKGFVYRASDVGEPKAWGLARADASLRPAYVSYQVAALYFSRVESAAKSSPSDDVDMVTIRRPGEQVRALWTTAGRDATVRLDAAASSATLVDKYGNASVIQPKGGKYRISLPGATCNNGVDQNDYIVGGDPFLLVEQLPAPAVNLDLSTDKSQYVKDTDTVAVLLAVVKDESDNPISGLASSAFVTTLDGASVSVAFIETATPGSYTGDLDISGLAEGTHQVEVTATDTRDLSASDTAAFEVVTTPTEPTMHVASIDMSLRTRGPWTNAIATVTIVAADSLPVEGATVSGHWSGATSDSDTGVTGADGKVSLESDKVKNAPSGTTFTFTVDNVVLSGWTYDSSANTETTDSITVP